MNRRFGMDESSLIRNRAIRPDEDVIGNSLAEYLYFESVRDNLLRLTIDFGVNERDIVVTGDNVAERGEALLDALDGDGVWEGVADVLQLLIGRRRWHKEAVTVTGGKTANDARASDGGVHYGDDVA